MIIRLKGLSGEPENIHCISIKFWETYVFEQAFLHLNYNIENKW